MSPAYANVGIPLIDLFWAVFLLDNMASAAVMRRSRRLKASGIVLSLMVLGLGGKLWAREWWFGDACTVGVACVHLLGDWMKTDGVRPQGYVEVGWKDLWESLTTWKRVDKQHDE